MRWQEWLVVIGGGMLLLSLLVGLVLSAQESIDKCSEKHGVLIKTAEGMQCVKLEKIE